MTQRCAQRLSDGGRQRIVEKFNWRHAAEETLAVYEEVVRSARVEPRTKDLEPSSLREQSLRFSAAWML